MGNEGEVIVVVTSSHAPGQGGPPVTVGLRRITLAGEIDPSFGLGTPSVAPPIGGQIVGLFSPPGASASDYSAYTTYRIGGICWLDGTLYVVGTGFSGGATEVDELFDGSVIIVEHPVYNYLVLTQWSGAGLRDTTDPAAVQELGGKPMPVLVCHRRAAGIAHHPDRVRRRWYPLGPNGHSCRPHLHRLQLSHARTGAIPDQSPAGPRHNLRRRRDRSHPRPRPQPIRLRRVPAWQNAMHARVRRPDFIPDQDRDRPRTLPVVPRRRRQIRLAAAGARRHAIGGA